MLRLLKPKIRPYSAITQIDAGTVDEQLVLDAPEHGWRDADLAVDKASRRFGAGAVRPAALVTRDGDELVRPVVRPPRPSSGAP